MTDEIAQEPERWERPAVDLPAGLLDAPALALTAFALSVLSCFGAALFSGYTYLGQRDLFQGSGVADDRVGAQLLGAGLALLPALIGLAAARRSTGSSAWVDAVARAAVLVAMTSVVLRLVVLAVSLATSGDAGLRFV